MQDDDVKRKVELYLEKAAPMFENIGFAAPPEKLDMEKVKHEFYEMALCYYNDAKHFFAKKEYENALASLEYAEGWLDAGRRLGIFVINKK